jgi:hypothetical protein
MARTSLLILHPYWREPAIVQAPCGGWDILWNPSTKRFLVDYPRWHDREGETVRTYAELRNARAYARAHPLPKP